MSGYRAGRNVEYAVPALSPTFASRVQVDTESGCWIWTGGRDAYGYGAAWVSASRRIWKAHQAVWVHFHGPVPSGLELDHLCSERACCNPSHLEPVTHAENLRRTAQRRTGCPQGHPWDDGNTYLTRTGWRQCRKCNAERSAARRRRGRATA